MLPKTHARPHSLVWFVEDERGRYPPPGCEMLGKEEGPGRWKNMCLDDF